MMQNELITKNLSDVGEDIGQDLGAKMVKDFQDAYPAEVNTLFIGRTIIDQILAQPGCVGIRFYNALNEAGKKTLVYVGIDENEEIISEYSTVNTNGSIVTIPAIVADRAQQDDPDNGFSRWGWL